MVKRSVSGYGQVMILPPAATVGDYATIAIADRPNPDGFLNVPWHPTALHRARSDRQALHRPWVGTLRSTKWFRAVSNSFPPCISSVADGT